MLVSKWDEIDMLLKVENKTIKLMKPHIAPQYGYRTVLSNSTFEYVSLWLRSQTGKKYKDASFLWKQAKYFYEASLKLPIEAKPLTAYYSIMNATKALLAIKGKNVVKIGHGVSSPRQNLRGNIRQDIIIFGATGVLCGLSEHLGESMVKQTYCVFDLLYNLPCVHRTFTITYNDMTELFVPVSNVNFELTNLADVTRRKAYIRFDMDSKYDNYHTRRYLDHNIEYTQPPNGPSFYRIKKRVRWNIHTPIKDRMSDLVKYHRKYRNLFYYIQGSSMLWYVKKVLPANVHIIDRHSMTIIYGVMHWLSELVRYSPDTFNSIMSSRQNWLIREFIDMGLPQFIDEISSEITGANIMLPGYRK